MNIKILGTGCPRCKALEQVTRSAVTEMGIAADIEKVEDIVKIMNYGVMRTPALVIDEKIALSGRVPSLTEIKEVITKNQQ
ncbi:MAG: TM0996/MTH895 family glutaredoxin-like protein [Bacteroidales bacterium]|nr:TM0996/MTH895 family glutaredoxin-like protein [Bacteroidales bacterium]